VTLDSALVQRARTLAHARRTGVSGLIAELLEATPLPGQSRRASFAARWAGKFRLARPVRPAPRFKALAAKYHLRDA